jgi:hypothetical protein
VEKIMKASRKAPSLWERESERDFRSAFSEGEIDPTRGKFGRWENQNGL